MSLSQFEEPVGHWRGADGSPSRGGNHGGLAVAEVEAAAKRVPHPEMLCKRTDVSVRVQAFRGTRERKMGYHVLMALNFPNPSRSYDARGHRVRFWGYDEVLEIPFFVEEGALSRIYPQARGDEAGFLRLTKLRVRPPPRPAR